MLGLTAAIQAAIYVATRSRSKGATYARTTLTVEQGRGEVLASDSEFVTPVAAAVTPDPAIHAMLAPYRTQLAAIFDTRIGSATGRFPRDGRTERTGEAAVGNLVADAMRERYGTQLALTNGGGLRSPLPSSYVPADTSLDRTDPAPYDIVTGDVFTLLPFGNVVVTRTVTGTQLYAALENGVSRMPGVDGRFPQLSGFRFTFDSWLPAGWRVMSVTLADGTPVPRDGTLYTLATNDFMNAGGDGYTVLADGVGTSREVMADVVLAYIQATGTITPSLDGRIDDLATDEEPPARSGSSAAPAANTHSEESRSFGRRSVPRVLARHTSGWRLPVPVRLVG